MSSMAQDPVVVAGYGTFLGKRLKVWSGTATTDGSGAWSVDFSAAAFSSTPRVFVEAMGSGSVATSEVKATLTSRSTTAASGIVTKPNTATITVATIQVLNAAASLASSGVSVDVFAIGE